MEVRKATIQFDSCQNSADLFNTYNLVILVEDAKTRALAHEISRLLDELEASGISRADFLRAIAHTFEGRSEIWNHLVAAADEA